MKYLIVNGDDFGASPGTSRGIIRAHTTGILTSTSLLVDTPWSRQAAVLSEEAPHLSIGLHADLRGEVDCRDQLRRQFDRFCDLIGREPTHLDSHHNIHRDPRFLPAFRGLAEEYRLPLRDYSPIRCFTRFYGRWGGESHPEQISTANLLRMLASEIRDGITELSCHPGYVDSELSSSYAMEREIELRTLCDPEVRRGVSELSIRLVNHREAAAAAASATC